VVCKACLNFLESIIVDLVKYLILTVIQPIFLVLNSGALITVHLSVENWVHFEACSFNVQHWTSMVNNRKLMSKSSWDISNLCLIIISYAIHIVSIHLRKDITILRKYICIISSKSSITWLMSLNYTFDIFNFSLLLYFQ
jgi:hypothetical protein